MGRKNCPQMEGFFFGLSHDTSISLAKVASWISCPSTSSTAVESHDLRCYEKLWRMVLGRTHLVCPMFFLLRSIEGFPKPLAFSILSFLIISNGLTRTVFLVVHLMSIWSGDCTLGCIGVPKLEGCHNTDFVENPDRRPLGLLRFHKRVDVFGRPVPPCIYDMNQFQRKIRKKLEALWGFSFHPLIKLPRSL